MHEGRHNVDVMHANASRGMYSHYILMEM